MTALGTTRIGTRGAGVLGVGAAALVVMMLPARDSIPAKPIAAAAAPPSVVDRWLATGLDRSLPDEGPALPPSAAAPGMLPADPRPEVATSVAFTYLGALDEGGRRTILLQGGGRVLKVVGPGPLDGDYVVDTVQDGYAIVRHARLGRSQLVEFRSRLSEVTPNLTDSGPD